MEKSQKRQNAKNTKNSYQETFKADNSARFSGWFAVAANLLFLVYKNNYARFS